MKYTIYRTDQTPPERVKSLCLAIVRIGESEDSRVRTPWIPNKSGAVSYFYPSLTEMQSDPDGIRARAVVVRTK